MQRKNIVTVAVLFAIVWWFKIASEREYIFCNNPHMEKQSASSLPRTFHNKDLFVLQEPETITFGNKNDTALRVKNLCIHQLADKTSYLSVYNSKMSYSKEIYGFNVQFVASDIPQDSQKMSKQTAFLTTLTTDSNNLYHMINDVGITLFSLLQYINGSQAKNR